MFLKSIRDGYILYSNYLYYSKITTSAESVVRARRYADALGGLSTYYPEHYKEIHDISDKLAKILFGYYTLNLAADLGRKTFNVIVNQFPIQHVKHDDHLETLAAIGVKAEQVWRPLIWSRYVSVPLAKAFGIPVYTNAPSKVSAKTNLIDLFGADMKNEISVRNALNFVVPLIKSERWTLKEQHSQIKVYIGIAQSYDLNDIVVQLKTISAELIKEQPLNPTSIKK